MPQTMQNMNAMEHSQALQGLANLYAQMEGSVAAYTKEYPHMSCPASCYQCCTEAAPLVSEAEFVYLQLALKQLKASLQEQVFERALTSRRQLEAGDGDRFVCPLLHQGRCLLYVQRPYLCRSFGQSCRPSLSKKEQSRIYACPQLMKKVDIKNAPVFDFRISALRSLRLPLLDSYLPIWLTTSPAQRRISWRKNELGIMTRLM